MWNELFQFSGLINSVHISICSSSHQSNSKLFSSNWFKNLLLALNHNPAWLSAKRFKPASNILDGSQFTSPIRFIIKPNLNTVENLRLGKEVTGVTQYQPPSPKITTNIWIHTEKHRNTSKASLLYLFSLKKENIMIHTYMNLAFGDLSILLLKVSAVAGL